MGWVGLGFGEKKSKLINFDRVGLVWFLKIFSSNPNQTNPIKVGLVWFWSSGYPIIFFTYKNYKSIIAKYFKFN